MFVLLGSFVSCNSQKTGTDTDGLSKSFERETKKKIKEHLDIYFKFLAEPSLKIEKKADNLYWAYGTIEEEKRGRGERVTTQIWLKMSFKDNEWTFEDMFTTDTNNDMFKQIAVRELMHLDEWLNGEFSRLNNEKATPEQKRESAKAFQEHLDAYKQLHGEQAIDEWHQRMYETALHDLNEGESEYSLELIPRFGTRMRDRMENKNESNNMSAPGERRFGPSFGPPNRRRF
jgi:hypothetical protein